MTTTNQFQYFFGNEDESLPEDPPYYAPLRAGDYATGLPLLLQYIRQEDAHAMSCYASLLLTGKGVPEDSVQSALWFRQAALGGDASGMAGLGMMHLKGHGVAMDVNEAAFWLFKALLAGHQKSATFLLQLLTKHPELFGIHFSEEEFGDAYADAFEDNDTFAVRKIGTTLH